MMSDDAIERAARELAHDDGWAYTSWDSGRMLPEEMSIYREKVQLVIAALKEGGE